MSEVLVVGGGMAGLSCALWLARAGRRVRVLERSQAFGGRARSHAAGGFSLDLGPHALYRAGAAAAGLKELGIPIRGTVVPTRVGLWRDGVVHSFGGLQLYAPALLPGTSTAGFAHWAARLALGATEARGRTVAEWLDGWSEPVRRLAGWLVRLSTYAHAPHLQDAEVAAAQVRRALRGVWYLDGGWQSLVDDLRTAAEAAGVTLCAGVDARAATATTVETADGTLHGDAVVLAVPPATARRLGASVPALTPVRAACLDLGLDRLPVPAHRAVFGLDQPLYFSTSSAVAIQGPPGTATVHAARYLAPDEEGGLDELERWVDTLQPGWRERVIVRRAAPALTVTGALDVLGQRRPGHRSAEGHWLVGDWVGDEGLLADAAVASARRVAQELLAAARLAA